MIVFELTEVAGGTKLTITESGFDEIPAMRRAAAYAADEQGWQAQAQLIAKYLARPAHPRLREARRARRRRASRGIGVRPTSSRVASTAPSSLAASSPGESPAASSTWPWPREAGAAVHSPAEA